VDSDRSLHTEGGLGEVELETKDRVSARTGPRTRPTGGTRGAEESVHDVQETDERPSVSPDQRAATARRERVTAHVDDLLLSFVGEDLVRGVDLFELLLRFRVRVDVRVVLPCQPPVSTLDFLSGGIPAHAENAVVVLGHCVPCPRVSVALAVR